MVNNDTSVVLSQMHDSSVFDKHKQRISSIETNTKEAESKIKAIEENNKMVSGKIKSEDNKFSAQADSQLRKTLISQLNSPFPMMSTEARLKAL